MSSADSPELAALAELEDVIRHASDELASWRRRALKAESERADLTTAAGGPDVVAARHRLAELEGRNQELEERLEAAKVRVSDLLKRLAFLEEQVALEEHGR